MKILLVGNYERDNQKSMRLYCKMLEEGLISMGQEVRVIRPEIFFGHLSTAGGTLSKLTGYMDKFFIFPGVLKKALPWADIVHICDHSNAFYSYLLKGRPHLITCHDLLAVRSSMDEFKEHRLSFSGKALQRIILKGINNSSYAVCVSEYTKKDILRISRLSKEQVSVIYSGLNFDYRPVEKEEAAAIALDLRLRLKNRFFLHVGDNSWYKNKAGALKIFADIVREADEEFDFVFIGPPPTSQIREIIKRRKLEKRVKTISNIEGRHLRALYSLSAALIYPSLAEGFGWPVIEAQACGCPVFANGCDACREIGGDAACYIEADKPRAAAREILDCINNPQRLAEMREAGFKNAGRFSSGKMIKDYLGIYELLSRKTRG